MSFNFENQPINFKRKTLLEDTVLREKLLAKKYTLVDQYRPKETDFTDIYSKAEINIDLAEIETIKSTWQHSSEQEKTLKDISSLYEGVIADQVGANGWFGPTCESVPASEYDDIKNGIDVVTIFSQNDEKEYLGLGVDLTFATDKKVLEGKLEGIKMSIKNMHLPSLKYFQDPETDEHKKISLPKVIIGSRLSSAEKLIRLWGGDDSDRNHKLAEHPVSSKIILESLAQLRYFYEYAKNLSEHDPNEDNQATYQEIAVEYGRMYNIFIDIYEEKKQLIDSHLLEISDDIVYETIINYTKRS
jgi:hypothetical protein